jgi:hypothetical protein
VLFPFSNVSKRRKKTDKCKELKVNEMLHHSLYKHGDLKKKKDCSWGNEYALAIQ